VTAAKGGHWKLNAAGEGKGRRGGGVVLGANRPDIGAVAAGWITTPLIAPVLPRGAARLVANTHGRRRGGGAGVTLGRRVWGASHGGDGEDGGGGEGRGDREKGYVRGREGRRKKGKHRHTDTLHAGVGQEAEKKEEEEGRGEKRCMCLK